MKAPALNPVSFFIDHGEKLIFGIIGLFSLLMLWWGVSAAQTQALDRSRAPEAVANLSTQALENIQQARDLPGERVPSAKPLAPRIDPWRPEQVKVVATTEPPLFDKPLFTELTKRTKPEVFPVTDLQAVAGVAVFSEAPDETGVVRDPSRGGPVTIAPFVIVTGLIPVAKQQAEFARLFSSASYRDPRRDNPRWAAYRVERARVIPGGATKWEVVAERGAAAARRDVGGFDAGSFSSQRDDLPPGFLLQPNEADVDYAALVPARVDRPWGEEVIHSWFMPLIREAWEKKVEEEVNLAEAAEASLAAVNAKPADYLDKEVRLNGVVLGTEPQQQRDVGLYKFGVRADDDDEEVEPDSIIGDTKKLVFATSDEFGRKIAFDLEGRKPRPCNLVVRVDSVGVTPVARVLVIEFLDADGEITATRNESRSEPVRLVDEVAGAQPEFPVAQFQLAENRLFRFVDRDVVPGAEYRYRVRFAIKNPNAGLAIQHVADATVSKGEFLIAAYSPESPAVRIPDATRILARMIPRDAAKRMKVKGDSVEVLVMARSNIDSGYALRGVVTAPGGVANVDPALNRPGDARHFGQPVTTDRLLLDIRGTQEDRIDPRATVPAELVEMILLRPDGEFDIVTTADSEIDYQKYKDTYIVEDDLPFETNKSKKQKTANEDDRH